MKNSDTWQPTKFVRINGKLRSSPEKCHVGISSRLFVDKIAAFYDETIPIYVFGRLIDLGCGTVPLYDVYKRHTASITCLDWSEESTKSEFLDISHDITVPLKSKNVL
jgi:hypothetical protein